MQEKDYQNYDFIEIIVKKENAEQVISAYSDFSWEKISVKEDAKYNDILHVEFCRLHDIANKDRLQLLQVYYEFALNERADLKEKKHHKSKAGICNLIVFAMCLFFGIWSLIFYTKTLPIFIGGIVLSLCALVLTVFFAKKLKNLYKLENQRFKIEDIEKQEDINKILDEARLLTSAKVGGEV